MLQNLLRSSSLAKNGSALVCFTFQVVGPARLALARITDFESGHSSVRDYPRASEMVRAEGIAPPRLSVPKTEGSSVLR